MLLKDCDRLVRMEVTREEMLDEVEAVDSTTDCEVTPVKKFKKADSKQARMEAARGRAKALLSACKQSTPTELG